MTKWCEIDGCFKAATSKVSGIAVCERCRIGFVSIGMGAVNFAGSWHGVAGVKYSVEQNAAFPGLLQPEVNGDLRSGPWARQARDGR